MSAPAEPGRSLAASSTLMLVGRLVANAGFFIAVLILARVLGPEGRGSLAFLTVSTLVLGAFAGLGVTSAAMVFVPQRPERRAQLLTNTTLFMIASGLVWGAAGFGLMIMLNAQPTGVSDVVLGLCVGAVALTAVTDASLGFLLALNRTMAFATVVAISPWLYASLLLAANLRRELNVDHAIAIWLVWLALAGLLTLAVAARRVGFGRPDIALLWETLRFGIRAWIGGLAGLLNFRFDQVLMGFLASEAALGIYAVAVNVSEALFYVPTVLGLLMVPLIARTSPEERDGAVLRLFRLSLLVTIGVSLAGVLVAPLIPIVFGSDFRGSVTPFLLLLPGAVGFTAMRLFSSALVGSSRPGRSSIGPLAALVSGVVLDLALIPSMGATGAAVAATTALLTGGIASLVMYHDMSSFPLRSLVPVRADVADLVRTVRRMTSRVSYRGHHRGAPD